MKELDEYKNKPVFLYHFSNQLEVFKAARMLTENGFSKINVLMGGIWNLNWRAANIKNKKGEFDQEKLIGMIHISIKQKPNPSKPTRKIETLFGDKDSTKDVYDNFASQVMNRKSKPEEKVQVGLDMSLVNPADAESKKVESEIDPAFTEDNSKKINK